MKTRFFLRLTHILLVCLLCAFKPYAQGGALKGKIIEKTTKDPIPFTTVVLEKDGKLVCVTVANIVGEYYINPVPPGTYDLKASNISFSTVIIKNIVISKDKITQKDITLEKKFTTLSHVEIVQYKVPLISKDQTSTGQTITADEIDKMPGKDAGSLTITTGSSFSTSETVGDIAIIGSRAGNTITYDDDVKVLGSFSSTKSSDISIKGSRTEGVITYIDGVKVTGSSAIPRSAIDEVSVITGGLPACYGDISGGVISVKMKFCAPIISDYRKDKPIEEIIISDKIESDGIITFGESNYITNSPVNEIPIEPRILTAGELNDYSKWELWKDVAANDLFTVQKEWNIYPNERYTVQVTNLAGKPVIDCKVSLISKKGDLIWSSKTDNTGKAELWLNLFESEKFRKDEISIMAKYKESTYSLDKIIPFGEGVNSIEIPVDCNIPIVADVLFAVDATSSMSDEMEYLKVELNDIILKVNKLYPFIKINLGCVFYRDFGDEYITRKSDFSFNIGTTVDFIKQQFAVGGGDYPEAVDKAFNVAINDMKWSNNAIARMMFLILDAPPHNNKDVITSLNSSIKEASSKGIRIIPITASGIDKSTEFLMRSLALATNGTYVFLTDHSNVGDTHIKPSTDEYDVMYLNDLIVKLFYKFLYVVPCDKSDIPEDANDNDTMYVYNQEIIDHIIIKTKKYAKDKPKKPLKDSNKTTTPNDNTLINTIEPLITTENKEDKPFEFKYFPNPTSGPVKIEIEGDVKELYLADITGKLLEKYKTNEKSIMEINIDKYPTGIYFIQYIYKEKWISGKIILQH